MNLSKSLEVFNPNAKTDRIHIIGCGSVGSTLAELLTRYGLTRFTLWDFDTVEPHNIANQKFTQKHIGMTKVEALLDLMCEINPEVKEHTKLEPNGWDGQQLSGYVFLCPDNIEVRQKIVDKHMYNPYVKAMFDIRTGLFDAQHYAVDWSDVKGKKNFRATMNFSHEEAKQAAPVSACNIQLGVAATVRLICDLCIANFTNFWNGSGLKKMILMDSNPLQIDAI